MCMQYINDINSGAIIFIVESLNKGLLFNEKEISYDSKKTGFTYDYKKFGISKLGNFESKEKLMVFIRNKYELLLASIQIQNEDTEKEAICIANIIIISHLLAPIDSNKRYLFPLADRCKDIIDKKI